MGPHWGYTDDTFVILAPSGRTDEGPAVLSAERMMLAGVEGWVAGKGANMSMSLRKGALCSAPGPHTPRFSPVPPQKLLGGG